MDKRVSFDHEVIYQAFKYIRKKLLENGIPVTRLMVFQVTLILEVFLNILGRRARHIAIREKCLKIRPEHVHMAVKEALRRRRCI